MKKCNNYFIFFQIIFIDKIFYEKPPGIRVPGSTLIGQDQIVPVNDFIIVLATDTGLNLECF